MVETLKWVGCCILRWLEAPALPADVPHLGRSGRWSSRIERDRFLLVLLELAVTLGLKDFMNKDGRALRLEHRRVVGLGHRVRHCGSVQESQKSVDVA